MMLPYLLLTALQLLSCQGRPLEPGELETTSCSEVQTVELQLTQSLLQEQASLGASTYPTVVSTHTKTHCAQNGNSYLVRTLQQYRV